jgi:chemotaxis signal transduction protein
VITPEVRVLTEQMEAVWQGRANRLAKRPVRERTGQSALPVIVLGIGKERYGVDLPDVAEILPPVRITPVPGAAAVFAGVINVHGEVRPVIDLKRLLGMGASGNGAPARVILLRRDGREVGLQIDSVEQIEWIGDPDLSQNDLSQNGLSQHTSSKYVRRSTKDLLMLLSTEELFRELNT